MPMTDEKLRQVRTKFNEAMALENEEDWDGGMSRYQFAARLERQVLDLVAHRQLVEERWYNDARQYRGRYDSDTLNEIRKREGASELFLNLTRPKTMVLRARIADVMLPQDQANWTVHSSPVPDLPESAVVEVIEEAERMAAEIPVEEGQPPKTASDLDDDTFFSILKQKSEEIAARARLHMEDQLNACNYPGELFKTIHDGCKFGTGVLKGPMAKTKRMRRWGTQQGVDGRFYPVRVEIEETKPVFKHVHVANWYPDPEASSMEECEFTFERHKWSRSGLRKAAREMGFDARAVNRLLEMGPTLGEVYSNFLLDVRDMELTDQRHHSKRFYVWEYRGPADSEEIRGVLDEMNDEDLSKTLGYLNEDGTPSEEPPEDVPNIVCYIAQGVVLLLEPDILDTDESIYSVFTLDPEETSMYGDGIPAMLEHPQRALNAAWRLTLDNAGLVGSPMFIVDEGITPVDGVYKISPRKLWKRNSSAINANLPGITPIQINASVVEGLEITNVARQLMSDESMVPLIAQGEQSGAVQQTAHGMTLLTNAVNTTFRQIVRSIDLFLTTPCIRRLYQWNKQFGPDYIQGDAEIVALGSSVLLVREVQAGQRMTALNMVTTDPELGDYVNKGELFRLVLQAMQLPTDQILYSDEIANQRRTQRLDSEQQAAAAQSEEKMAIEQMRQEGAQATEERRQQTELERLSQQRDTERAKLEAQLAIAKMKNRADERKLAVEGLLRRATGQGV